MGLQIVFDVNLGPQRYPPAILRSYLAIGNNGVYEVPGDTHGFTVAAVGSVARDNR